MPPPIETDYLVVGSGATAMSFIDTLLTETDAQILVVDRHDRPGGHWNDAYSFVRLHQPAAFYGVNSRELGETKDRVGLNEGLYSASSGPELLAYFDQVMQQRFLPSGRVSWFPMCEYREGPGGTHQFRSLTCGVSHQVTVRRKLVDATLARTAVPSTHPPKYAVAPAVQCIPINGLPGVHRPHAGYTVVGAGKTGIDACVWLLENGVAPASIRWIMPRDHWLQNRTFIQPGPENFESTLGGTVSQFEAIAAATSVPDLLLRLEERGLLLRFDPAITPSSFHCATVSPAELHLLRTIKDVVRLGHVQAIEPTRIVLEHGTVHAGPDTLYIDCSARGRRLRKISSVSTPPGPPQAAR